MQFIKNRVGSDVSNISPDQTGLIITKLRFSDVNEKNCVINSSEHVHVNRYQKNRKYIDSVVLLFVVPHLQRCPWVGCPYGMG